MSSNWKKTNEILIAESINPRTFIRVFAAYVARFCLFIGFLLLITYACGGWAWQSNILIQTTVLMCVLAVIGFVAHDIWQRKGVPAPPPAPGLAKALAVFWGIATVFFAADSCIHLLFAPFPLFLITSIPTAITFYFFSKNYRILKRASTDPKIENG